MLQVYTSLFECISTWCKKNAIQRKRGANYVTLNIASGYHSYMLDISKSCGKKVCMHQSKLLVNYLQLNNTILIIIVSAILADK